MTLQPGALTPSANERLRRGWERRMAWATAIAVAAHVAAFALVPSWRSSLYVVEPIELESGLLLVVPNIGEPAAPEEGLPTTASVLGDEDPLGTASVGYEGPVVTAEDQAALWDALGDRLRRGRVRVPAVAVPETRPVPEPEPPTDEGEPSQDEDPTIDADASAIDLAELPEPDSLSLDRLSSLRPELAFMTASAWVLIRNQVEVETYLKRSYRNGTLDPSATGSVSITLWIDRRGSVEWAEISKSSGRPDLDEFALALFNEVADFRAARERGVYISRSVTFSVNFPW